eukprot:TRINITY_DN3523_c0_g1_i2.p1 TRINITY_DN3523_c0_g1~~TRINITY_DN3523_c0_g1_i2.p1  ORF type:complete len:265 (+),score=46.04 TRINITY_DN3523_c0_g1_i2:130-924(+)
MTNNESPYFKKKEQPILVDKTPRNQIGKLLVNKAQKGNRLLNYIKNVDWMFESIAPDYVFGNDGCALFLSCRFHMLHESYIYNRMKQIRSFKVKILLVLIDMDHNEHIIKELSKLSMVADFTMILTWSLSEAGRYLETYKLLESKGTELLKHKPKDDYRSQVLESLTSLRGVNKTDVQVMIESFDTVKGLINASMEELTMCPGIGEKKVKRLLHAFNQPFRQSNIRKQSKINFSENKQSESTKEEPPIEEEPEEDDSYQDLNLK